ncbi:helix-hairpin-helix domain-containing protein [Brevibacillus centrosporus]|uniref:Competence protein ComEA n=1 Tax=Brevibacillus centrosporus TaxID=54910 RepID=A0A1I3WH03_9BACL|nr:helix-hairpin-helix domain-containing protein [Brevibacillus centrosporus]MED4907514.1 helix-hairpin-helix domain-containing protein [Brevibacillus centrosporus]SFK05721.1 competence protein ComEA [Brevibacillus centrosporus]
MFLEWWDRYRKIFLTAIALLFVTSSFWLYQTRVAGHEGTDTALPLVPPAYASDDVLPADEQAKEATPVGKPALEKTPSAPAPLYVDVKGDVKQPGLYPLDAGMRVADAIAKAGGANPTADLAQINLAAPLVDGTAIVIPVKESSPAAGPVNLSAPAYAANGKNTSNASSSDQTVSLNSATAEELMTLPGIGEARAKAIMQYREEKGSFRALEELKSIEGIGDKLYERIAPRIRIH